MRDRCNVENRKRLHWRVIAGMVAKWTLQAEFIGIDVSFNHNFSLGWHLQWLRDTIHKFYWSAAQVTCQKVFIDVGW